MPGALVEMPVEVEVTIMSKMVRVTPQSSPAMVARLTQSESQNLYGDPHDLVLVISMTSSASLPSPHSL